MTDLILDLHFIGPKFDLKYLWLNVLCACVKVQGHWELWFQRYGSLHGGESAVHRGGVHPHTRLSTLRWARCVSGTPTHGRYSPGDSPIMGHENHRFCVVFTTRTFNHIKCAPICIRWLDNVTRCFKVCLRIHFFAWTNMCFASKPWYSRDSFNLFLNPVFQMYHWIGGHPYPPQLQRLVRRNQSFLQIWPTTVT